MSRRNKKLKRRRKNLYLAMAVVGVFLATLVVQGVSLRSECQKLATEQAQLHDKIKSLKKEKKEIEEQKEYTRTDAYVEEVAREKFGLVYEDEIIFKAEE